MRKFLLMLGLVALVAVSCDKDPVMIEVPVQLAMDGKPFAVEGVTVTLTSATANLEAKTDASGKVTFTVPVGNYTASASFKKAEAGIQLNYNGTAAVNVVAGEKVSWIRRGFPTLTFPEGSVSVPVTSRMSRML
ncbi:MAG: carboxypeptidase regulatory-like domain-containing protein [Bacteroidales bacterium]|nr:carboxypeptidase regulatory-like domain-containing protein [Bacteroidales bacterium]